MQMGVFEFPGTVAMFGLNRDQAAALLEEVERTVTRDSPAVSLARFGRSHGKDREREVPLESYAEERKRQNAEVACRRASERAGKEPDRLDRQSEGGMS